MGGPVLPPGPSFRNWKGDRLSVSSFYSLAGISTSIFCDHPGGRVVMEAGDGCIRDLLELEREIETEGETRPGNVEELRAVVISHPHYDHYAGLLNVLNFLHLLSRKGPLPVIHPAGSSQIGSLVDHFLSTLWEECPFDIDLVPCEGRTEMKVGGLRLRTVPVTHRYSRPGAVGDRVPAMAYSLTLGRETVAYSGDTCGMSPLEELFRGADLGIVESTFHETPLGHHEVHMDLAASCRLGSLSKKHWHVHFTAISYRELKNICPDMG